MTWRQVFLQIGLGACLTLFIGCQPLYHSYSGVEPRPTTLPVTLDPEELWVTSIPAGADVYVQPFIPERLPSHSSDVDLHKGTAPLRLTLPPGRYWIEVALDADVFANYFSPPYDDVQFEKDGANSEALVLQPFAPGEKRRVVRYYLIDKFFDQGQTVVALFHPRGAPLDRVVALYPQEDEFQMEPEAVPLVLQEAQPPADAQTSMLALVQRGGKAFWARDNDFSLSLEVVPEGLRARVIELYRRAPLPSPLLPDGGGF